jgi:molecular chaperone GrpE
MSKRKRRAKQEKKDREDQPPQDLPAEETQSAPLAAERDDLLARLQRVSADYLNYQKRVRRDIEEARQFANADLIKALLSVLDDMERGLDAARENHDPCDPLLLGMGMVHKKALETLGKFGLEKIDAEGKPFDPEEHSAMMQEPSDEHPGQTVLRELQTGYRLKGRTIRPSSVVVSQRPEDVERMEGGTEDEQSGEQPQNGAN